MIKKKVALAMALLGAIISISLWPAQGEAKDFFVKSFTPEGLVPEQAEIVLQFSDEVAHEITEKDTPPLAFTPPLRGRGAWKDARTYSFRPNGGLLAPATSYLAEIAPDLKDRNGQKLSGRQSFKFHSKPLEFLGAKQVDYNQMTEVTTLELSFSAPVSPNRLLGYIEIKGRNSPIPLSPVGPVSKTPKIALRIPNTLKDLTLTVAKGLPPAGGNLGLAGDESVKLTRTSKMEVMYSRAESRITGGAVSIGLSSPVDFSKLASFIELTPKTPFSLEPADGGFAIAGKFSPQDRVRVTLKAGLPAYDGKKMESDWSRAFIFPERESSIRFSSAGRVISPAGPMRLPIETVNIDSVRIAVWKLYENNIPAAMKGNWNDYPTQLSDLISEKEYSVKGERDQVVKRALDLGNLIGNGRGVYMITAYSSTEYAWADSSQIVNVTDFGVTVTLGPDSAKVMVNSLSEAKPVSGAIVTLWSWANQPVANARTDGAGEAECAFDAGRAGRNYPVIVTVKKDGDIAFVRLSNGLYAGKDEFDTSGRKWVKGGYDAYCALPRNIFRPGEKVDLMCIVRGADFTAPSPFPVSMKVLTPTGKLFREQTEKLSDAGTAFFSFEIPADSPLGTWRIQVGSPGSDKSFGKSKFYVEEFSAPRLFVKAEAAGLPFIGTKEIKVEADSKYVFGGPASGLSWESGYFLTEKEFVSKSLPGYRFVNEDVNFVPSTRYLENGTLDRDGRASFVLKGGKWRTPSMAEVNLRIGVFEDGGREVNHTITLPWYPADKLLGIKLPDALPAPGRPMEFAAALAGTDGANTGGGSVKYTFFRVASRSVQYEENGAIRTKIEEELIKRSEGELALRDGFFSGSVTPDEPGRYLLVAEDTESGARAARYVYACGDGGEYPSVPDRVTLMPDKKVYRVGDTANIKVRSPFAGNVLYEVGTYRTIESALKNDAGRECTITFKVTKDMLPNAWVSVQAIRPAGKDGEPVRACGLLRLDVDNSESKLTVSVTGGRVEPGKRTFALRVKDSKGRGTEADVFVMLTDEAVLGLMGFETPDPWAYFTAKRELGMETYDMYGYLIEQAGDSVPLLNPGGDAAAVAEEMYMKNSLSPVQTKRFKILAMTKVLKTDKSGKCEYTLDIPEFAGQGRLMAVAAAKDKAGSGAAAFGIHRDIVVETAFPRALAPQDTFTSQCRVFNKSGKARKITVTVRSEGGLKLKSSARAETAIAPDGSFALPLKWEATGFGTAKALVTAEWEGGRTEQVTEIPIRPATAKSTEGGAVVIEPGREFEHTVKNVWFKGTVCGTVMLSPMPFVSLADLARFLSSAPAYGIDQTISAAWALLLRPELVKNFDPAISDEASLRKEIERKIQSILALQAYDGGFSSVGGEGNSREWESVYAAHFLSEAKASGYGVPEDSLNAAVKYLLRALPQTYVETDDEFEWRELISRKAYICYVLVKLGQLPLGWMESLRERTDQLFPSGRFFLAASYAASGNKRDAKALLGSKSVPYPAFMVGKNYDTPIRDQALELIARNEIDPTDAESASAALALLEKTRETKYLGVHEAGFAMLALAKYFNAQPAEEGAEGILTVGGKTCAVGAGGQTAIQNLNEPAAFKAVNSGKSRLFAAWSFTGIPVEKEPNKDNGLKIRQTLTSAGKPVGAKIAQGSRIEGRVTLTPLAGSMRNVAAVIPLPSGMEIESAYLKREGGTPPYLVRAEKRDDRLILFVDNMYDNVVWHYALRAVTPGDFAVPQISAQCVCIPSIFSVSGFAGSGRVEITKSGK